MIIEKAIKDAFDRYSQIYKINDIDTLKNELLLFFSVLKNIIPEINPRISIYPDGAKARFTIDKEYSLDYDIEDDSAFLSYFNKKGTLCIFDCTLDKIQEKLNKLINT